MSSSSRENQENSANTSSPNASQTSTSQSQSVSSHNGQDHDQRHTLDLRPRSSSKSPKSPVPPSFSPSTKKMQALERLIREKNCELNLAGTVGQQLLDKYAKKQEEFDNLSNCYLSVCEELKQTKHDLDTKSNILINFGIFDSATQDSPSIQSSEYNFPIRKAYSNLSEEIRKRKLEEFELEVQELREEKRDLEKKCRDQTCKVELMKRQFLDDKNYVEARSLELESEIDRLHNEETFSKSKILKLIDDLVESNNLKSTLEEQNENLSAALEITKERFEALLKEVGDTQDSYNEAADELQKANIELRELRSDILILKNQNTLISNMQLEVQVADTPTLSAHSVSGDQQNPRLGEKNKSIIINSSSKSKGQEVRSKSTKRSKSREKTLTPTTNETSSSDRNSSRQKVGKSPKKRLKSGLKLTQQSSSSNNTQLKIDIKKAVDHKNKLFQRGSKKLQNKEQIQQGTQYCDRPDSARLSTIDSITERNPNGESESTNCTPTSNTTFTRAKRQFHEENKGRMNFFEEMQHNMQPAFTSTPQKKNNNEEETFEDDESNSVSSYISTKYRPTLESRENTFTKTSNFEGHTDNVQNKLAPTSTQQSLYAPASQGLLTTQRFAPKSFHKLLNANKGKMKVSHSSPLLNAVYSCTEINEQMVAQQMLTANENRDFYDANDNNNHYTNNKCTVLPGPFIAQNSFYNSRKLLLPDLISMSGASMTETENFSEINPPSTVHYGRPGEPGTTDLKKAVSKLDEKQRIHNRQALHPSTSFIITEVEITERVMQRRAQRFNDSGLNQSGLWKSGLACLPDEKRREQELIARESGVDYQEHQKVPQYARSAVNNPLSTSQFQKGNEKRSKTQASMKTVNSSRLGLKVESISDKNNKSRHNSSSVRLVKQISGSNMLGDWQHKANNVLVTGLESVADNLNQMGDREPATLNLQPAQSIYGNVPPRAPQASASGKGRAFGLAVGLEGLSSQPKPAFIIGGSSDHQQVSANHSPDPNYNNSNYNQYQYYASNKTSRENSGKESNSNHSSNSNSASCRKTAKANVSPPAAMILAQQTATPVVPVSSPVAGNTAELDFSSLAGIGLISRPTLLELVRAENNSIYKKHFTKTETPPSSPTGCSSSLYYNNINNNISNKYNNSQQHQHHFSYGDHVGLNNRNDHEKISQESQEKAALSFKQLLANMNMNRLGIGSNMSRIRSNTNMF